MAQQSDVASKIREYEAFVNDILKADLQKAQQVKSGLQADIQEFEELERNLAQLQQDGCPALSMRVDLGGEVLAEAHVPDTTCVYISIGLGFHVEVPLSDAPRVIKLRKEALQQKLQAAMDQVVKIRTHIRMTEQTLAELQALR